MNILSVITGFTLFFILHTLNTTYIYFKRKKEILFYIIEMFFLGITIICSSIPYHYFQSFNSKLFAVYPIFLIMINLATITFVFFISSKLKHHTEDKVIMYALIPALFFLISLVMAYGVNKDYTQTIATQPQHTAILYKTELESDVTLSYYRNNFLVKQKDEYPTKVTTLKELQELQTKRKNSIPTIVVTAQGATSEIKPNNDFEMKLHTDSDETSILQLATPEQIQINVTQIRLTKLARTQIHWMDTLFQTNYTVQGDPLYILEIDYEITNLEQLQNTKDVQQKLDNLLQQVK